MIEYGSNSIRTAYQYRRQFLGKSLDGKTVREQIEAYEKAVKQAREFNNLDAGEIKKLRRFCAGRISELEESLIE